MKVYTVSRPYTVSFSLTGARYPLSSEEAQRLIDSYPVLVATRNRVTLRADDGRRTQITAATLGGGPAFVVER